MCGVLVAQVLQRSCSWPAQVAVLWVFDENKGVGAAKIRGKTFRPNPTRFVQVCFSTLKSALKNR